MNKKFFVPFETAKLLKEKGYPQEDSDMYYTPNGELKSQADIYADRTDNDPMMYSYFLTTYHIAAPTYHEVVDWLLGKGYPIESACIREYSDSDVKWLCGIAYTITRIYLTREEALNEAIIKALNAL